MTVDAKKGRITGRIWQSIAQSGVDVAPIPRDQLDKMVDTIADGVLLELDAMLGEAGAPQDEGGAQPLVIKANASGAEVQEEVLWEGRPFLSIGERYVVTSERVRIITGLIGRDHEDIELVRMKDVDHTQGITERMLNIGDITLHSADASLPNAVLRNVSDPEKVHEIIRRAMLNARKRYPFVFEQKM